MCDDLALNQVVYKDNLIFIQENTEVVPPQDDGHHPVEEVAEPESMHYNSSGSQVIADVITEPTLNTEVCRM